MINLNKTRFTYIKLVEITLETHVFNVHEFKKKNVHFKIKFAKARFSRRSSYSVWKDQKNPEYWHFLWSFIFYD